MPDIEEMVMAISQLQAFQLKLEGCLANKVIRGAILESDEVINETRISLNTALQVLEKRLEYHMSPQNLDVDRTAKALS
jgi:hypothetical protein